MDRVGREKPQAGPRTAEKKIQLRVRDGFALLDGEGNEVRVTSKKARGLLLLLALAPQARLPVSSVASSLWGSKVTDPRRNLAQERCNLHKLVRGIGGELLPLGPNDTILIDRSLAAIDLIDELDAIADCDHELDLAVATSPSLTSPPVQDKYFESEYDHAAMIYRARRSDALNRRWRRILAMDLTPERHRTELVALTTAEPCNEEWCRHLMAVLGEIGTAREIRKAFDSCKKAICADELDCDVEPATHAAHERALMRCQARTSIPSLPSVSHRQAHSAVGPELLRNDDLVTLGVHPIENETRDAELCHLARQLSSSLLIDVGKIARPFAFIALADAPTSPAIARSLCDYVLTAGLQTAITEKGVFAEVGYRIVSVAKPWIGRQSRVRMPLVETRDDRLPMSNRLANKIQLDLFILETARLADVADDHLSCQELIVRGLRCVSQQNTPQGLQLAEGLLSRALTRDPRNVDALTGIAHIQHRFATQPGYGRDPQAALTRGSEAIRQVLSLDPEHVQGAYVSGMLLSTQGEPDQAAAVLDHVISISAHNPALAFRGYNDLFRDRVSTGLDDIRKAFSRTQDDTALTIITFFEATAHYHRGDLATAIAVLEQALSLNSKFGPALVWRAGLEFLAGDHQAAAGWLARVRTVSPTFTLAEFDNTWGVARSKNREYLARLHRLMEALKALGLPQGR